VRRLVAHHFGAAGRCAWHFCFAGEERCGNMTSVTHRRTFSLRTLVPLTAFAGVLAGAYRVHPILAGLVAHGAILISVMAWFAWSDIAMSVCTLLLFAGLLLAAFL
jgi:hypothetical protein